MKLPDCIHRAKLHDPSVGIPEEHFCCLTQNLCWEDDDVDLTGCPLFELSWQKCPHHDTYCDCDSEVIWISEDLDIAICPKCNCTFEGGLDTCE
jgi:hypothetical protein